MMVRKRTTGRRSRTQIKKILEKAFRTEFPADTVDISDGYQNNVHVMVISRRFDKLDDKRKSDLMWQIIDGSGLHDDEKLLISLILPLSPAEIK